MTTRTTTIATAETTPTRIWTGLTAVLWLLTMTAVIAADFTWDGNGNGSSWNDPLNWTADSGYPGDGLSGTYDIARIPIAATITSGVPSDLNQLHTGSGAVDITYSGTLNLRQGATWGRLDVGSGGVAFSDATLQFINGNSAIAAAGDLTMNAMTWGNSGSITQTGGLFYIDTFRLPLLGAQPVKDWAFGGTTPTTFTDRGTPFAQFTFTGTPTFTGGHRPNWVLNSGVNETGNMWDLNGYTMTADAVTLKGGGSPNTRHAYIIDDVGGVIDANSLVIGANNYVGGYVNLHNTTVLLQGGGTIYDNRSVNNDGSPQSFGGNPYTPARAFDITDNTTVTLDPAGGTASIDTGSYDFGNSLAESSFFLGNEDNFAFDVLQIGDGDVITLVGDANWNGGGTNALYANELIGLGAGGTLDLNNHNIYLLNDPVNMTFIGEGGVFVVPEPSSVALLALAGLALLRRRR